MGRAPKAALLAPKARDADERRLEQTEGTSAQAVRRPSRSASVDPMKSSALCSLLLLAFLACGDSDPNPVDGGALDAGGDSGTDSGPCATCTTLPFQVEFLGSGGAVALEDGAVVEWEWGFQGGTMITPRILFDEGVVEVGQEVRVEIRHAPDPSAPDAYGQVAEFPGVPLDLLVDRNDAGRLVLAPINDQLGWDDLDGTRLILSVAVRTGDERGTQSGAITLQVPEGTSSSKQETAVATTRSPASPSPASSPRKAPASTHNAFNSSSSRTPPTPQPSARRSSASRRSEPTTRSP